METTTVRLFALWKQAKGFTSDLAAAKALGVSHGTPSNWKAGRSHAEPALAARMAHDLRLDELAVLAAVEADRATKVENRKAWQRHGRGAFMALAVGLAVPLLLAAGSLRSESQAKNRAPLGNVTHHYAK